MSLKVLLIVCLKKTSTVVMSWKHILTKNLVITKKDVADSKHFNKFWVCHNAYVDGDEGKRSLLYYWRILGLCAYGL